MILNNGILTRRVNSKKHYFIKYKSYSFDSNIINKYKGKFHTLQIKTNKGKTYSINANDFWNCSKQVFEFNKHQTLIETTYLHEVNRKTTKTIRLTDEIHTLLKKRSIERNVSIELELNNILAAVLN